MPYFIVRRVQSQEEALTLVDPRGFGTRTAAETAAQERPAARGLVVQVAIVEAATAAEALRHAPSSLEDGSAASVPPRSQSQ